MHYLTKLFLDPAALRKEQIRDDYSIHRFVYSLFPKTDGAKQRLLYHDKGAVPGGRIILVLSEEEPACPECVSSSATIVSDSFLSFTDYRFEVELNPVRTIDGKRRAVTGQLDLLNWFIAHSGKWGFQSDTHCLEVFPRQTKQFPKDSGAVVFNRAVFRGRLHVTDKTRFQQNFFAGLGHGKAFGFGLLQLNPVTNNSTTTL